MLELRMGDADRDEFGGPEWVPADWSRLDGLSFAELDALERPIWNLWRTSIRGILTEYFEDTARGHRGGMWLARKLAGIPTPDLAEFDWDTRQISARVQGAVKPDGDEDPPQDGPSSSATSSAKARSKKR